jgi:2-phosphoglycerate kinase
MASFAKPIIRFGRVANHLLTDRLDVRGICEPSLNVNIIDQLVMKAESNKTEVRDKAFFADIVEGKGEGQVILLHGPPGTGKTLTAGMISRNTFI